MEPTAAIDHGRDLSSIVQLGLSECRLNSNLGNPIAMPPPPSEAARARPSSSLSKDSEIYEEIIVSVTLLETRSDLCETDYSVIWSALL